MSDRTIKENEWKLTAVFSYFGWIDSKEMDQIEAGLRRDMSIDNEKSETFPGYIAETATFTGVTHTQIGDAIDRARVLGFNILETHDPKKPCQWFFQRNFFITNP